MENTNTTTTPTKVKLFARCEAATWDNEARDVELNNGVEPKWIVKELIIEIQALQAENAELKKQLAEKTQKAETTLPEEKL